MMITPTLEAPHYPDTPPTPGWWRKRRLQRAAPVNQLRHLKAFAGCSSRELADLASLVDVARVPAGARLATEGNTATQAAVILSGRMTVSSGGRAIATLGRGDVVGEIGLLARRPRTADVVADTDVALLVSSPRDFATMLARSPRFTHNLLRAVAARR